MHAGDVSAPTKRVAFTRMRRSSAVTIDSSIRCCHLREFNWLTLAVVRFLFCSVPSSDHSYAYRTAKNGLRYFLHVLSSIHRCDVHEKRSDYSHDKQDGKSIVSRWPSRVSAALESDLIFDRVFVPNAHSRRGIPPEMRDSRYCVLRLFFEEYENKQEKR